LKRFFKQAEKVAGRTIGEEAVVVNVADGYINVFNSVGAAIWEFLQVPRSMDEIIELISNHFEYENIEEIKKDVEDFLKELEANKLISITLSE